MYHYSLLVNIGNTPLMDTYVPAHVHVHMHHMLPIYKV